MRRSMLFVPGNNPKMMVNCGFLGADAIIFDLEDAVSPEEKDAARLLVKYAISNLELCGCEVIVRVNAVDTPLFADDLAAILPQHPALIMLPKTASAADIQLCDTAIAAHERAQGIPVGSTGIIALIETALGVENAFAIATAAPRVRGLFLGAEDLSADLHCSRTRAGQEIFYARTRLVMAARAAGIAVYDTPFTDVNDDAGIVEDSRTARALGFDGKASISPRHVSAINRCFSPTQSEVDYAREVLDAIEAGRRMGKGAVALRGKMIDAPIVARAEQTLAAAEAILAKGGTLA